MAKRVFIVHGWGGNPNEAMLKYLKRELASKGYSVIAPQMPNTDNPKITEWTNHLSSLVGKIDEDTHFIGESIGCQTIMRYLETLNLANRVGSCTFIAGWFNLDNLESQEIKNIARPWIENKIDLDKIKEIARNIRVFISDNEPYGFVNENAKVFREKLGATVFIQHNKGHFTEEDGVNELPEALDYFK